MACGWLLLVCTAVITAAAPALAVDPIGGRAVGLQSLTDDLEALLPPVAASARSAAYDDLSGPAAASTFRLFVPDSSRGIPLNPALEPPGSLRADAAAERGPPPSL